jgi:endonuclease/exonuclease/phosphatase family metal-dependent hydrolase
VPTYHTRAQGPAGAQRQLDFVFASRSIAERVTTRALNDVEEWGASDHCRVAIEVDE